MVRALPRGGVEYGYGARCVNVCHHECRAPVRQVQAWGKARVQVAQPQPQRARRPAQVCHDVKEIRQVQLVGEVGQGLGYAACVAVPVQGVEQWQQATGQVRDGAEAAQFARCNLVGGQPRTVERLVPGDVGKVLGCGEGGGGVGGAGHCVAYPLIPLHRRQKRRSRRPRLPSVRHGQRRPGRCARAGCCRRSRSGGRPASAATGARKPGPTSARP